ncbi:MAG: RecQ family ATP-dependent DNA helicase [Saprospiraceae bacterium]|nr:RecQ family ATP-dependent DNA helicase [Saprospiraceae bacterium]
MQNSPHHILKQYWGYDQFRPLQEEIIMSVLEGKDTLALLPTGGGKSICFQVPALCKEGTCLVISPLIALMKDQVSNLRKVGVSAAAIFSGMSYKDIDITLDNAAHGHYKFLYVSPERLKTELMQERLKRMNINLIAVDEAHCISQWGYDFRPSYLEIASIREWVPDTRVIALTATATPEVVEDIQERLLFKSKNVFEQSFERKNLAYAVLQDEGKEEKLLDILKKVPGTAIVYVRSRRRTKELAWVLGRNKISADYYHAGLSPEEREKKQEAWKEGKTRVMISTNAFGMGIDKANVRLVVHTDLPESLEAYFQEAGRAGRDGQKAYAVLLYDQNDRKRLEKNYKNAFPPIADVKSVYQALGSYFQLATGAGEGNSYDFDVIDFSKNYQFEPLKTFNCLKILEQSGWIVLTEAIFIPSTLKILVSKEKLYDYQIRNPKMEIILKSILRSYQGAFMHFIKIREKQLAKFLKIPVDELIKALELLQQESILQYNPQKDQPQIIFVRERANTGNLDIDQKLYNFRKKQHKKRMEIAIQYAEKPICRSKQLLAWFGQKDAHQCGICDVCTGRTKTDLEQEDFERYRQKIEIMLNREHLSLEEIVESFNPRREAAVLKSIEYLMDEGFIEKDNGKLKWKFSD